MAERLQPEPTAAAAAAVAEAGRLERAGRLAEAAATYQALLDRWPALPDCWYNLGLLQRRLGRFDAALESYAQALRHGARQPEQVHLNRAVVLTDCLRQDAAAERELEAALSLNPAYLPALQNLANLHEDLGRREQALSLYRHILELEPRAFQSLARYAQLVGSRAPEESPIARLRAALDDPAASPADRASLGFALAHLLDAAGQYPAAFAAVRAANGASRASVTPAPRYDRQAHEHLIDALIAAFPLSSTRAAAPAHSPAARPQPVFICGMFRSGSTLTERLLAGHPGVAMGGELDLLPRLVRSSLTPFPRAMGAATGDTLVGLARGYLAELARLFPGATYVTDKRPENFLYVGLIRRLFPEARIVHTSRDALDTCLSIYFLHLDPHLSWALDLMDIGHYFRQYRRLMTHWQALCGEDMLDFNYDTLVREPASALQRLVRFCGLEQHDTVLEPASVAGSVKTASVWQVREPLYQRASGRSRHYAAQLAALEHYLARSTNAE